MRTCVIIGLFALTIYGLVVTFAEGWNGQSRWALSLAIARRGTTAVDEFIGESRDVCVSRGRLYAAKAPGMGIAGAPLVWCADRIVPSVTFATEAMKRHAVRLLTVSLAGALVGVMLCSSGAPSAALAAAACCVGSPVLPLSSLLYGHVPAALFLLAAWRLSRGGSLFLAGLVAGWGVVIDYLTAVGVAALAAVILVERRRGVLRMIAGMLPAGAVLAGYNMVSFGTVLASGYEGLADEEFAAAMSHGFQGVGFPSLHALGAMLFGTYRGLFLHSPWLLLWPVAAWKCRREWQDLVMTAAVPALYLVVLSGFPVWWGGASCAVRHAVVMLPLAAWAVGRLEGRWRLALLILGVVSSVPQFLFTVTEPEMPEDVAHPLWDFVIPHVMAGRFRPTALGASGPGQWTALTLAAVLCAATWVAAWHYGGCCRAGRVVSWRHQTINHGNARRRTP